jgi:hypothetical protein
MRKAALATTLFKGFNVSCNYLKNNTIGLSPEMLKFIDFLVSGSCIIQGCMERGLK